MIICFRPFMQPRIEKLQLHAPANFCYRDRQRIIYAGDNLQVVVCYKSQQTLNQAIISKDQVYFTKFTRRANIV